MENYCRLTGVNLNEEKSPIKKMCLNCKDMVLDGETYRCKNEVVNEKGRATVLAAIPEGFEIDSLNLKPYLLKDPTKKCSNYNVSDDIAEWVVSLLK